MLDKHLIVTTFPVARNENIIISGDCRITVLSERLFRIEQDSTYNFCDHATQSVWFRNMPEVSFQIEEDETQLRILTNKIVLVWKGSLEKSYVMLDGVNKIPLNNQCNLLGTYRTLDGCDGDLWIPYSNDRSQSHKVTLDTGVVSRNGVAILDDRDSLILKKDGTLAIREHEEMDCYVFAYGHDYREAVKALYMICGRTPLIPRFAFGNWWSRYHAYTEKEYLHTMDRFAERDIPFTVATVDMDWHWSDTLDEKKHISDRGKNDAYHGGNNGWTGYSWNTDLFPDYCRFLNSLHERGLRVTLNLHPADGVRYFENAYEEFANALGIDPVTEKQIPFDIADTRFINAYFQILHKPYEKDGVDFWWIDWQQGNKSAVEGLDPLWSLNHYHYLDIRLNHTPLILSRYCGAGSHRYPIGFSGDTHVTWDSLEYLVYFTATASNIGYTWWSHDIGGHMCGCKDDELYVRFLQFGVFSPINRLHSTNCDTFTKEPWAYMNGTGLIAEHFLRFRHRMIPFLFSASYETTENGLALVEPVYYEYPDKEEAYSFKNQYLFGRQLLVAPITTKSEQDGMARCCVWLPEGKWTDIFTGDEYSGGQTVTMVRWMDSLPVLLKEGGFFVLDDRKATNSVENPDILKILVSNGNGAYTLHEEQDGQWVDTLLRSEGSAGSQKVTICCRQKDVKMPKRKFHLKFCNIVAGTVTVTADGKTYPAHIDDNGRVTVTLDEVRPELTYEILIRFVESKEGKHRENIRTTITRLQMENEEKEALYKNLCANDGEEVNEYLQHTTLPEIAKLRLLEQVFSNGTVTY